MKINKNVSQNKTSSYQTLHDKSCVSATVYQKKMSLKIVLKTSVFVTIELISNSSIVFTAKFTENLVIRSQNNISFVF